MKERRGFNPEEGFANLRGALLEPNKKNFNTVLNEIARAKRSKNETVYSYAIEHLSDWPDELREMPQELISSLSEKKSGPELTKLVNLFRSVSLDLSARLGEDGDLIEREAKKVEQLIKNLGESDISILEIKTPNSNDRELEETVQDVAMEALAKRKKGSYQNLKKVGLRGMKFEKSDVEALLDAQILPQMEVIDMRNTLMDGGVFRELAENGAFNNVRELLLSDTIQVQTMDVFSEEQFFPQLSKLDISRALIAKPELSKFLKSLVAQKMNSLHIGGNHNPLARGGEIKPVFYALSEVVKNDQSAFMNLEELGLAGSEIDRDALAEFISWEQFHSLRKIDLSQNNLAEAVDVLVAAAPLFTQIEELKLIGSGIDTPEDQEKIQDAFPNAVIIY